MERKRIFKVKTFARWARGVLSDAELCKAAREVAAGFYEADLGGGVCKKRVAQPGKGKSGSARTLIAKKHQGAIFFLAGREKSESGNDFSDGQVLAAKLVAKGLQAAADEMLTRLLTDGTIKEICREES